MCNSTDAIASKNFLVHYKVLLHFNGGSVRDATNKQVIVVYTLTKPQNFIIKRWCLHSHHFILYYYLCYLRRASVAKRKNLVLLSKMATSRIYYIKDFLV